MNSPISYAASKSAILNLTRYLAVHWRDKKIRVNCLVPGGVFDDQADDFVQAYSARTPLGRMAGADEYLVPAPIGEEETARVRQLASLTAEAIRCPGAVRVDFRGSGDELSVIEVNTIPGMTPTSLLPMSAKGVGISFDELVLKMLASAGEGSK